MAKDEGEKQKRPRSAPSMRTIVLVVLFFAGLFLGGFVTHQFIEPMISANVSAQLQDCNSFRYALDAQVNECSACLNEFNIEPETCSRA